MKKRLIKFGSVAAIVAFLLSGCGTATQPSAPVVQENGIEMENANPQRGKQVYAKKFYKSCGITCEQMAKKHTQKEWETAFQNGKVQELISQHNCTIMDDLNKDEQRLVYDFMYYHAKGSGHVAQCTD